MPWWGAGVVVFIAVLGPGCPRPPEVGSRVRPPPLVVVAPVQHRDVAVEVRAPVDLRPLVQADVGSKALGYLDAVLVERGDAVHKGQLLALVRPSDLPDQLTAARGTVAQAESAATLARADLDRAQALAPKAVVSQQELQQTTSRLAQAKALEDAARAQLGALAVRLGETRILSPLSGVVVQRRLDAGALVGPPGGGVIVTVARVDVLRVFISINEREIVGVKVGQDAHVELDALPGRSFHGRVVRLAPTLEPTTRTLDAEVQLDNREGLLRPGMYGRGAIVLAVHTGALTVPVGALQLSERRAYTYVLDGELVHRRAVETGVDGGEWVEITSGLRDGEQVVTSGIDMLAEGTKIRMVAAASPPLGSATPTKVPVTAPGTPGGPTTGHP